MRWGAQDPKSKRFQQGRKAVREAESNWLNHWSALWGVDPHWSLNHASSVAGIRHVAAWYSSIGAHRRDNPFHPSIDLTGTEHTPTGPGYTMSDVLFSLQRKAFIMSLFRIETICLQQHSASYPCASNLNLHANKKSSVQGKREHLQGRAGDTKGNKPFRANQNWLPIRELLSYAGYRDPKSIPLDDFASAVAKLVKDLRQCLEWSTAELGEVKTDKTNSPKVIHKLHSSSARVGMKWYAEDTDDAPLVVSLEECFLATHAKVEHDAGNVVAREKAESSKKIQPQGEYDPFVVDVDYPERQVRVGKALPASIKHIVQKMLTDKKEDDMNQTSHSPLDLKLRPMTRARMKKLKLQEDKDIIAYIEDTLKSKVDAFDGQGKLPNLFTMCSIKGITWGEIG
ncbi:hypothetical protein M9H77_34884 [Catharanthus roseus]|uniref:Uncharacterized protein n=1 Tax=Catharanthus roseus TaxID=4058 RepID=A0ACB9ZNC5_CATRO|nr:hypothetical protein M9H77_34884 [Catharanthus roseus]